MSGTIVRCAKPELLLQLDPTVDIVIEASAGTGKTFTIENLVIDLLLSAPAGEALSIENILVVTFTEKATAELRGRLRQKIEKLAQQTGSDTVGDAFWDVDDGARARLRQALFMFDAAPIHTIHGFCQRVLSENAFQNRQLFRQEQVDGHIAFSRTFRAMLRDTFTRDAKIVPLLDAYLAEKSVDDLDALIFKVIGLGGAIRPVWDEAALKLSIGELAALYDAATFQKDCSRAPKVKETAAQFLAIFAHYQESGNMTDLCAMMAGLPEIAVPKNAGASTAAFIEGLNAWCMSYPAPASRLVQELLPRILERLTLEKKQKGIFDYQDMLNRVRDTLEADAGGTLIGTLRSRYRYAILDEFQDTDETQWKIFKTLFMDGPDNTLIVVGDPKQAIYGFRGCDVHTYDKAVEAILPGGHKPHQLPANYRSTPGIVAGYNRILQDLRQGDDQTAPADAFFTGFNRYPDPVTCGFPSLRLTRGDGSPVESVRLLHFAPTDEGTFSCSTLRRIYGEEIASEIHGLLMDPARAVHLTKDGAVPAPENRLAAKDIFVLTENNNQAVEMAKYLRAAGVPYAFYKQEGLFQTAEAGDIRDVLAAVAEPERTSRRLKAWGSPFFAVPWRELPACRELPASDPLYSRLLDWKSDADAEHFGHLFGRILDESGIVERELFQKQSERDVTNYRHIFEILLEVAAQSRCTLPELISALDNYIREAALPAGENGGLQRIESEKDAVQIMTLHKSKGLEAGIVFLYALAAKWNADVHPFHTPVPESKRALYIGGLSGSIYRQTIDQEWDEEKQRLLYVGMTRAEALLYLPFVGAGSAKKLTSGYGILNRRLAAMREKDELTSPFAWQSFGGTAVVAAAAATGASLQAWMPSEALLTVTDEAPRFLALRAAHQAFTVTSSTAMHRRGGVRGHDDEHHEKTDEAPAPAATLGDDELRPGIQTGLFLHELMEAVDPATLHPKPDFAAWCAARSTLDLFQRMLRKYQIDARFLPHALTLVYRGMTNPLPLGDGAPLPCVAGARMQREMEFLYPIPESFHPRIDMPEGGSPDRRLHIERGFLKGFVDLVFEHEGKAYLADWKGNLLPAPYAPAQLDYVVQQRYETQLRVYSLALVKMLEIHDEAGYQARFGGILYVFLRGLREGGSHHGVYFRRPAWRKIVEMEAWLQGFSFV